LAGGLAKVFSFLGHGGTPPAGASTPATASSTASTGSGQSTGTQAQQLLNYLLAP
jgi:hypothetical protein